MEVDSTHEIYETMDTTAADTKNESYSILEPKLIAQEFDCAILNFTSDFLENKYVILDPKKSIQTKFGMVVFKNLIGKEYGSKHAFSSNNSKGYFFLLHLTPELWTTNLNHRTQILYSMDISMIVFELDLVSGSRVIETGTGSGSLSHSIARAIAPNGLLITHDYSAERVEAANQDFKRHGIDIIACSSQRNVLLEGFAPSCKVKKVDAVFLDLPEPWSAIKFAAEVLKIDHGRIACFCPCIEQVQRTCNELRNCKFQHIETKEYVLRPFAIMNDTVATYKEDLSEKSSYKQTYLKRKNYKYTHTGYLIFASFFG
ncbi:tRNA (adenine(58)-N(1))-methyltransferase catalytic subunit trmt61a-like [Symsagittifera roscoffensis]|uniref:tRNA (adenine(58)-N(1))-methyltransferase catalytic subunit trmt61a-like n=1 Tax=Symsagittifera roscoffensis TaxID=84072 RepID=UPI00307B3C4A